MSTKRSKKKRLRKAEQTAVKVQAAASAPVESPPAAIPAQMTPRVAGDMVATIIWAACAAVAAVIYLTLKMFSLNAYAGDEYIYLYQGKLIAEGVIPYSGFAMAHPPLQAIFTALIFKLFGYQFRGPAAAGALVFGRRAGAGGHGSPRIGRSRFCRRDFSLLAQL